MPTDTIPVPPMFDSDALLGPAVAWLLTRPGFVRFACFSDRPMHWAVEVEFANTFASSGDSIRVEAVLRLARGLSWQGEAS